MTAQTFLADGRIVSFAYDDNGNLEHLDVPSNSAPAARHAFGYTPVSLESAYTPPDSNWPGDGAATPTGYSYNLARDLTQIDRADAGKPSTSTTTTSAAGSIR